MDSEDKSIACSAKGILSFGNYYDTDEHADRDIEVPSSLLDAIFDIAKTDGNLKNNLENAKEGAEKLYEVIIKPEIKDGLADGSLTWDGVSAQIRDTKSKKIVGNIKVGELEIPDNVPVEGGSQLTFSDVTKSICTISGQVQMAEISKKIDMINEKIDQIIVTIWREKVARLKACNDVLEEAFSHLPDEAANQRINNQIGILHELSSDFLATIRSLTEKKVSTNIFEYFMDGLNVFELGKKDRPEYNKSYIKQIKEMLKEYSFLMDAYTQSMLLLGTSYQIIHGLKAAQKYYTQMHVYSIEQNKVMYNKIKYLLDVDTLRDSAENTSLLSMIGDRNLGIISELKEIDEKNQMRDQVYEKLSDPFNNTEIVLLVSKDKLCEECT